MITVLLLTYDISPYRGSEASVSWNYVLNMRQFCRLVVLYGTGKGEIEKFLCGDDSKYWQNVEFVNIPSFSINGGGLIYDIKYNLQYRFWHKEAYRVACDIISKSHIDVIHYLNPIGFKEPGYLWRINNIPYVWGPMQGVENRPIALFPALSLKGKVAAIARRVVHNGMFVLMPRLRQALKRTDAVFAATPNTRIQLKKVYGKDSFYLPENGILKMLRTVPIRVSGRLRLVWIGNICERKALGILIESLGRVKGKDWHLDVLGGGDGVLKDKLISEADKLGLSYNITWFGNLDRNRVQEIISQSHLLVISSLGEGNPTVIWEAMSWAVPTMTLDHCGMAGVINEECGIKIPIHSYNQVIADIATKIDDIILHPEVIETLSKGTIDNAGNFMWVNRVKLFINTYSRLLYKYQVKQIGLK